MSIVGAGFYEGTVPDAAVRTGVDVALIHRSHQTARAIRNARPDAFIVSRCDEGKDGEQYDTSRSAISEAASWEYKILSYWVEGGEDLYSATVGPNENWPKDWIPLTWRAAFENELCRRLKARGIPYLWGSISVGNLEAVNLHLFEYCIENALGVCYHGYLPEHVRTVPGDLGHWHLWRPFDLWLPEWKRLTNRPMSLFIGECGTYFPWRDEQMSAAMYSDLCTEISLAYKARSLASGVNLLGVCRYGYGNVGDQETWRLDGTEAQLAKAAALDGSSPAPVPAPTPTPDPEGEAMSEPLWIALIPSNQAYNRFTDDLGRQTDEKQQMEAFAASLCTVLQRYANANVRIFKGAAESNPAANPDLQNQLRAAYAWLDTAPLGTLTTGWSLHSDSGVYSHVGGYWGNADITRRLVLTLRSVLANALKASTVLGENYEAKQYLAWTLAKGRHCPIILECGSHLVTSDIKALRVNATAISEQMAVAGLAFFGIAQELRPTPVDPVTDALNGVWHFATQVEAAGDLVAARAAATSLKSEVVELKVALGKQ